LTITITFERQSLTTRRRRRFWWSR